MALRILMVGLVAGLGLELPTRGASDAGAGRGGDGRCAGVAAPAGAEDLAFAAVVEEMVAAFSAEAGRGREAAADAAADEETDLYPGLAYELNRRPRGWPGRSPGRPAPGSWRRRPRPEAEGDVAVMPPAPAAEEMACPIREVEGGDRLGRGPGRRDRGRRGGFPRTAGRADVDAPRAGSRGSPGGGRAGPGRARGPAGAGHPSDRGSRPCLGHVPATGPLDRPPKALTPPGPPHPIGPDPMPNPASGRSFFPGTTPAARLGGRPGLGAKRAAGRHPGPGTAGRSNFRARGDVCSEGGRRPGPPRIAGTSRSIGGANGRRHVAAPARDRPASPCRCGIMKESGRLPREAAAACIARHYVPPRGDSRGTIGPADALSRGRPAVQ
jgi:hypothetical protein